MSKKAEEFASKYVAQAHSPSDMSDGQAAMNIAVWKGCVAAYEQAEKDAALEAKEVMEPVISLAFNKGRLVERMSFTWEDVKLLSDIESSICNENLDECVNGEHRSKDIKEIYPTDEAYYTEILNRFKRAKENVKV